MRRAILLFAALLFAAPAAAAVTPQIETEATRLMDAGEPAQAYALLRRNHEPARAGAQQWFLLGLAAYRAGDLAAAETAFRQALARDPNAPRVKLELARVLQARGARAESERLFLEVRATNPPAQVAANIDRYLSLLQDREQTGSAWRARATVGAGYDSNVGNQTSASQVTLFGLPFTLGRDARKRGDGFAFFRGEIDHIYRFDRNFAWASNITFGARKYFREQDFDNYTLYASTGPIWQPDDRTTFYVPAFVNLARIENRALRSGERFYSNEFGVAPQVRYLLNETISLNLVTTLTRKHFFEQVYRNANAISASPGVDIRTASAGVFTLGVTAGRESSKTKSWSNSFLGANAGWQYAFAERLVGSLYANYTQTRYDDAEAAFTEARRDRKTVVGVDFIYAWELLSADLLLSYSYTWNRSNLPLYSYTKGVVSLGLRKQF